MGTQVTTNYGWVYPNPFEEDDAWGAILNAVFVDIDADLKAVADSKQPLDGDLTAIAALAGTSGFLTKTGANTWSLDTSTYQPLDADLTAIGALAGTSGFLKKTAANTWSLDTASYSLVGHTHVISDVSGLQTALDGKQPIDADLTALAALTPTADNFIVGNGTTWTIKAPADVRTTLGLGTLATLSAVGASEITDGSVGAAELASDAVTTVKIANANVTTAKIADANVTTAKIADANVTTAKIADASITPAKLNGAQSGSAPAFAARAWVNFNGTGTPGVLAGGNVSSITDNGVGDYTVNMTTAMADANYTVAAMASGSAGAYYLDCRGDTSTLTSSAFRLNVHLQNSGNPTKTDPSNVYAVVMR